MRLAGGGRVGPGGAHDGPVTSRILDRADLDFLLHDWLRVGDLLDRAPFAEHDRETIDAVLDLAEQIATERFEPHNRAADLAEQAVAEPTGGTMITVLRAAAEAESESDRLDAVVRAATAAAAAACSCTSTAAAG